MRRPSRAVRSALGLALCALLAGGAFGVRAARRGAAGARRVVPVTGLRSAWKTTLPFEASVVSAASRWLVLEAVGFVRARLILEADVIRGVKCDEEEFVRVGR